MRYIIVPFVDVICSCAILQSEAIIYQIVMEKKGSAKCRRRFSLILTNLNLTRWSLVYFAASTTSISQCRYDTFFLVEI